MPTYGFEVQEVPENDERGLHEHAQDIHLLGKVVTYDEKMKNEI